MRTLTADEIEQLREGFIRGQGEWCTPYTAELCEGLVRLGLMFEQPCEDDENTWEFLTTPAGERELRLQLLARETVPV